MNVSGVGHVIVLQHVGPGFSPDVRAKAQTHMNCGEDEMAGNSESIIHMGVTGGDSDACRHWHAAACGKPYQ
jgi:hypothetical protein